MSNAPSYVLQSLLVTASVAQISTASADWFAVQSKLPESPDRCMALYDYGGGNPYPHWNIDQPSVQVAVRGNPNDYNVGYAKCKAVKDTLLGLMSQDIDGDRWISIIMIGDINFLMRDDSDRPVWTLNFRILKETALNAGAEREAL